MTYVLEIKQGFYVVRVRGEFKFQRVKARYMVLCEF